MPPQRLTQLSNTASSNSAAWGQRDYFARHRIKTGLRGSNSSPTNCFCQYSFGLVQTNQESRSQPALDPPRLWLSPLVQPTPSALSSLLIHSYPFEKDEESCVISRNFAVAT